jgi:murein peptide amidase A
VLLAALPPAPPPRPVVAVFGRSVRGRALRVVRIGAREARRRVLVVGEIHGDEPAGRAVVRALARVPPPAGVALWLVATANPDGSAAGTRQNARGVDLNRNFPARWRPTGPPGSVYYAGPRPRSEPETRALARIVRRVRPTAGIWYHQHRRLVYRQGGAHPGLAGRYGRLVGLPVRPSPRLPGTAIRWENATVGGGTAWVVELPAGRLSRRSAARHARAVRAIALVRLQSAGDRSITRPWSSSRATLASPSWGSS